MQGQLRNPIVVGGKDVRIPSEVEVRALLEPTTRLCVTIQFPTETCGRDTLKGPIVMRNLIKEAHGRIQAAGHPRRVAEAVLEPAERLLEDAMYWQHLARGLVLYLGEGTFHEFRLPQPVPERVLVSERFHLRPILPLVMRHGLFYVLALSRKRTRLYQATAHRIAEVDLGPRVPVSFHDEIAEDDFSEYVEQKSVGATASAGRAAQGTAFRRGTGQPRQLTFHSQGGGKDTVQLERRLLDLCHHLDNGVVKAIGDPHAPLVLAGVEEIRAIYRQASNHPRLLERGIDGNVERLRPEEIHERAWDVVEPVLTRVQEGARERFQNSRGTGLALTDLDQILAAAAQGRIGEIFLREDREAWGRFDPIANRVVFHSERADGDEDLLNVAAIETLRNAGSVYLVPEDRMPSDEICAAVLRY